MPTIYKPPRRKRIDKGNRYDGDRRRIYNSTQWRRLSDAKLMLDPLCEMCAKEGRVTPAEDVHHIRSFMATDDPMERARLAYDPDNLMSLCKRCHQAIHNRKGS